MRAAPAWAAVVVLACVSLVLLATRSQDGWPFVAGQGAAAEGKVLWRADGSKPLHEEWASLATAPDCGVITTPHVSNSRITVVDDGAAPSRSGRYYKISVLEADRCYGARSELGQGNPEAPTVDGSPDRLFRDGQDVWISFAHRLAADYPLQDDSWSLVHQWKQTASYGGEGGYPILSLVASDDAYRMWGPGFSERDEQNPPTGRRGSWGRTFADGPSREEWHLFTLHVRWSPDPNAGFVELYGDLADGRGWRTLVRGVHTATMKLDDKDGDGEPIPVHARIGVYRDEAVRGGTHVDYAGYTVATSRDAAERSAFREEWRPRS